MWQATLTTTPTYGTLVDGSHFLVFSLYPDINKDSQVTIECIAGKIKIGRTKMCVRWCLGLLIAILYEMKPHSVPTVDEAE